MLTLEAWLDGMDTITVYVRNTYYDGRVSKLYLKSDGKKESIPIVGILKGDGRTKYVCKLNYLLKMGRDYEVLDDHGFQTPLKFGRVVRTDAFDKRYFYDGDDLGYTYSKSETKFKVWAPIAMRVKVDIHHEDGRVETHDMNRGSRGVWDIDVSGDLNKASYTYLIKVNGNWNEATDPYAFSSTQNHKRSVVVDIDGMDIPDNIDKLPPLNDFTDSIIYELSVRDFSVHKSSGINHKAKFLGVVEEGTTTPNGVPTGFDYLKSLGVTHAQFLPIYDFGSVDEDSQFDYYNWGYDPVQYNVPEGSYASVPEDPTSRVRDMKTMVSKLNEAGIRVVMDVVYNHMFDLHTSAFEALVPGYYFRYDQENNPSNGSFCGNDLASDKKMVRKYIGDSVLHWANHYGVRGFRFDLMGILDIETMNYVRNVLDLVDDRILVYGEGWNMPTCIPDRIKASMHNWAKMPRIGHFNDRFRDTVKGNTGDARKPGFIGSETLFTHDVMANIMGSCLQVEEKGPMFGEPYNTVNYIECHDNHTVWDKLELSNPKDNEDTRRRRQRLAASIVLLSQGLAFIHAGQEFNRTKGGEHNSYMSSDEVNAFDWERMVKYEDDVNYVRGLIDIRRKIKALHFENRKMIETYASIKEIKFGVIDYRLNGVKEYGGFEEIRIIINGTTKEQVIDIVHDYKALVFDDKASFESLETFRNIAIVTPLSVTMLVK
jgi:pullulanase